MDLTGILHERLAKVGTHNWELEQRIYYGLVLRRYISVIWVPVEVYIRKVQVLKYDKRQVEITSTIKAFKRNVLPR